MVDGYFVIADTTNLSMSAEKENLLKLLNIKAIIKVPKTPNKRAGRIAPAQKDENANVNKDKGTRRNEMIIKAVGQR